MALINDVKDFAKRFVRTSLNKEDGFYATSDTVSDRTFVLMLIAAYFFSLLARFIWVFKFSGYEQLYWNGEFIPLNHDAFYYAKKAKDALMTGVFTNEPLSNLTIFFVKALPFISFETIVFYISAFIGSLIVVPVMLVGRLFSMTWVGFVAALISSVAVSYYNRTMVGYYDTDMLNLVLPVLLLYFMMGWFVRNQSGYLIGAVACALVYSCWYPASIFLILFIELTCLAYVLIYERRNHSAYVLILLVIASFLPVHVVTRLFVVGILLAVSLYFMERNIKILLYALFIALLAGLTALALMPSYLEVFSPYLSLLETYFVKDLKSGSALHYIDIAQYTAELEKVLFKELAERISGHVVTFVISLIGCFFVMIRYRVTVLLLPLLVLGISAFVWGGRYTIYAVPLAALGFSYMISSLSTGIVKKTSRQLFVMVLIAAAIYPNINHIFSYRNPFVFVKGEIEALVKLSERADKGSYVCAYWDYGYPVQYYTGMRTLTDGGRNTKNPYIEAMALVSDNQVFAANILADSVWRYHITQSESLIEHMMETFYSGPITDLDMLLSAMSSRDYPLLKKSETVSEVYLFLPYQMIYIFHNVLKNAMFDLKTGQMKEVPVFYFSEDIKNEGSRLVLGDNVFIDNSDMNLYLEGKRYLVREFYVMDWDNEEKPISFRKSYRDKEGIICIYFKRLKSMMVVDQRLFNSLYVQLFVFENYDKGLFELIVSKPLAKIYKVKV